MHRMMSFEHSIMKINRAFPIEKLMASIDYYLETTNRRITFEYILLHDVNDHVEEATATCEDYLPINVICLT